MNMFLAIRSILGEILDHDPEKILEQTFLIRELNAESIDLLEIGVAIQHRLGIPVHDDLLFLKNLRTLLLRAELSKCPPIEVLAREYPHLSEERLAQILEDMPQGPVLRVSDLVAYVSWTRKGQGD